jgi:UDP-glucose:(heptosyl)LPS alpha-1,3-glucosyltransferase
MSARTVIDAEGVWGDEKRAALAEADVFCLPSTYESFGTAVVEAAALGVPVVYTAGCGARDVLDGCEVTSGDARALADAVSRSLKPATRRAAAQRARALSARLGWDAVAQQQLEIYYQLLKER